MTPVNHIVTALLALALMSCSGTETRPLSESAVPATLILEPVEEDGEADAANGKSAVLLRTGERARFELGDLPRGSYKVSVRARGDNYDGWPRVRLEMNAQQLGEDVSVESDAYLDYAVGTFALDPRGVIEAVFTNDSWGGSADADRNLYVDHLTLTRVEDAERLDARSCTDERLELGARGSPVWTSDRFEGNFCRDVVGDGERLTLTLDAEEGGFDTAVTARYNPTRVDDLRGAPLNVSATVTPAFSGPGNWWIGPKFSVREAVGQSLEGNYENYIVENASRTPEEYHERLTSRVADAYLGETRQNGGVYKHYLVPHPYQPWEQFWAVRQDYRESGAVDLARILELWRANGLPDQLIPQWRVNVETSGEVAGALVMDEISFPASTAEQRGDQDQNADWDMVYEELVQSEPLELRGVSNVLIRNSTFTDITGADAILIEDATNVRVENVTINGLSGGRGLSGVRIRDSTEVSVVGSTVSDITSPGQSAGVLIQGAESADITLQDNHIYDTYGNGIVSGGCSACANEQTVHDAPVPGLRIINNLIHDTGKTPSPVENSPTHGMYLKAQDVWVEGNTVYNSFDGMGISIRSTATVINNRIWDTRGPALFLEQMKPAGPSMRSVVRGNELFFTDDMPPNTLSWSSLLDLYWGESRGRLLRYDTFEVRDNTLSICTEAANDLPLMRFHPFKNLTVEDNDFVDARDTPRYLANRADLDDSDKYSAGNTFSEAGCLTP